MASGILAVPIHGAPDEYLELPKESLPDEPADIMQILASELAPLKLWLELAVSYYQQGRMEQFNTVMETSTGEDGPFFQDYYKPDREGRIALLNCLAAYNTQLAARSKKTEKKNQHFSIAMEHYQKSDKIDPNIALTWCGKGLIHMAKYATPQSGSSRTPGRNDQNEHLDKAGDMFSNALACDAACIPALLGRAAVLFNKRLYGQSLDVYKQVMTLNPASPPEVRLGLAHCYAALGRTGKAKKSFERVLQLSPDNVEATVALAIIKMNSDPDDTMNTLEKERFRQENIQQAVRMIWGAFKASADNQGNAMLLNHIANHCIFRNELDKAEEKAKEAYFSTGVRRMRAESCYHIARAHHIREQFDQAQKYYDHATFLWPDYLLPQYGLGQCYAQAKKWAEAIACFDKILKVQPGSYEARKMMACVCARSGDAAKAQEHFRRLVDSEKERRVDEEVWIEMAALCEATDASAPRALEYYGRAREALRKKGATPAPELLNNMAALHHKLGDHAAARQLYEEALVGYGCPVPNAAGELALPPPPAAGGDAAAHAAAAAAMRSSAVTVLYNLARLAEERHEDTYADGLYRRHGPELSSSLALARSLIYCSHSSLCALSHSPNSSSSSSPPPPFFHSPFIPSRAVAPARCKPRGAARHSAHPAPPQACGGLLSVYRRPRLAVASATSCTGPLPRQARGHAPPACFRERPEARKEAPEHSVARFEGGGGTAHSASRRRCGARRSV
jgi:RNA polymerase-associated protein CTR9